jgi:hypothetical protein
MTRQRPVSSHLHNKYWSGAWHLGTLNDEIESQLKRDCMQAFYLSARPETTTAGWIEPSFAIIDKDGEVQEAPEKNDDALPPLRTLERPAFAPASGFTPTHLRSGSSPSRSPVRQRRPRPTRYDSAFGTLPTFRPPKEPTTSFWDFIFA